MFMLIFCTFNKKYCFLFLYIDLIVTVMVLGWLQSSLIFISLCNFPLLMFSLCLKSMNHMSHK